MASGKQLKVRIAQGHVVYVDGVAHTAGQLAQLPAADAQALIDARQAEKA
jgi:hypothetical protein